MENVIWFSRHQPTDAQLAEIAGMGCQIAGLDIGVELGAYNMSDDDDVLYVVTRLRELRQKYSAEAIFGVWTAPMLESLSWSLTGTPCYAAWNVTRPVEGGKPVFEHRRFCLIGRFA